MKNLIVLSIFIFAAHIGISQNNAAAFLSYRGQGEYMRGNTNAQLKFPMLFNGGDKIKLTNGNAKLLIADGSEVNLAQGKEFIIPNLKKEEIIIELDASVFQDYVVPSQSNSIVSLRSASSSLIIFPISSKVIKAENAVIFFSESINSSEISFKLFNSNTFKVIYETDKLTGKILELDSLPLEKGIDYNWIIKLKGQNEKQLGIVSVLSDKEIAKLPKFEFNREIDYIKAYRYYEKNEFYFEAYNIIQTATRKYPDIDLFKYMLKKMRGE